MEVFVFKNLKTNYLYMNFGSGKIIRNYLDYPKKNNFESILLVEYPNYTIEVCINNYSFSIYLLDEILNQIVFERKVSTISEVYQELSDILERWKLC